MQANNTSLTKSSTINIIITNLSHITNKIQQQEQQSLLYLDKVVLNYISSRNKSIYNKNPTGPQGTQNKIQSNQHFDLLTLKGLEAIHTQSQINILQVQNKVLEFYKNRELIHQHNLRFVKDSAQITQSNGLIELCKQMMMQLAKYKDIQDLYSRLVEYRKKIANSQSHGELLDQLDAYFIKMANFVSDDQDEGTYSDEQKSQSQTKQRQFQEEVNVPLNINNNIPNQNEITIKNRFRIGQSTLLLDFIQ